MYGSIPFSILFKQINDMNEIYWITRFDGFSTLAHIFMIIGIVATVIFLLLYYINNGQEIYDRNHRDNSDADEHKGYKETCLKSLRCCIPFTAIFIVIFLFVPTTKEALAIYGIGGTIDYIKQNPTAKQLPDKCINALDKWVDSWVEEPDSIKKN